MLKEYLLRDEIHEFSKLDELDIAKKRKIKSILKMKKPRIRDIDHYDMTPEEMDDIFNLIKRYAEIDNLPEDKKNGVFDENGFMVYASGKKELLGEFFEKTLPYSKKDFMKTAGILSDYVNAIPS